MKTVESYKELREKLDPHDNLFVLSSFFIALIYGLLFVTNLRIDYSNLENMSN